MWNVDGPVRPCHRVDDSTIFARCDSDSLIYIFCMIGMTYICMEET
jgi:hypothetical protein